MAWKYWNPNPTGKHAPDCTVRAITRATGMSWDEAYTNIAIFTKDFTSEVDVKTKTLRENIAKNMPSSNSTWGAFLRSKGFKRMPIPDDKPDDYTVEDFCRDYPKGMYVVVVEGHVLTVFDGDWFDSWNSANEFPIYYYEKKESEDK